MKERSTDLVVCMETVGGRQGQISRQDVVLSMSNERHRGIVERGGAEAEEPKADPRAP